MGLGYSVVGTFIKECHDYIMNQSNPVSKAFGT